MGRAIAKGSGAIRRAKQAAFLEAFARCGRVAYAAKAAGINRDTHYAWLKDSGYQHKFEKATEMAVLRLEDEALERALVGVERVQFGTTGKPIVDPRTGNEYVEHLPSDNILMFLLKGLAPQRFR